MPVFSAEKEVAPPAAPNLLPDNVMAMYDEWDLLPDLVKQDLSFVQYLNQKIESLSDPKIVERTMRYTVSTFRRLTLRLQGRKLEFSPTNVFDADVHVLTTTPTSPICRVDDGLSSQRSLDVSVPLVDSGTKLQHVEAPRVVAVSAETVDTVVTTSTSGSLEEGIIIGDLYGSCHSVALVQEAIASSGETDACIVTKL